MAGPSTSSSQIEVTEISRVAQPLLRLRSRGWQVRNEHCPKSSRSLGFKFVSLCSSFADRLFLDAVGHTLRDGFLYRDFSKTLLHSFPDRFFYFLCGLLLSFVIRHRENPQRRLCPAIGNCTWASFRCCPRSD